MLQLLQLFRCNAVQHGAEGSRDVGLFHVNDILIRIQHGRIEKSHTGRGIFLVIRPVHIRTDAQRRNSAAGQQIDEAAHLIMQRMIAAVN
ncbi:hypothetical protein D3C81_1839500 [compost metagenome]